MEVQGSEFRDLGRFKVRVLRVGVQCLGVWGLGLKGVLLSVAVRLLGLGVSGLEFEFLRFRV